mgnify:CR=1 FL=1
MKQILAMAVLLVLALPASAQPAADYDTALTAAQEQGKLLLVDFFTDW